MSKSSQQSCQFSVVSRNNDFLDLKCLELVLRHRHNLECSLNS